jgi:hypothetical protein
MIMSEANTNNPHPWYREPIVWMAIAIPLSAVVYGMFFLSISITSFDGMVVDDYYKQGKQINRVIKRDKAAVAHQLTAQLMIEDSNLTVFIASASDYTPPPALEIKFIYSTRADLDTSTFVEQVAPGIYKGSIDKLEIGRWNVQIEADDWRLVGSLKSPVETKIVIRPAPLS